MCLAKGTSIDDELFNCFYHPHVPLLVPFLYQLFSLYRSVALRLVLQLCLTVSP